MSFALSTSARRRLTGSLMAALSVFVVASASAVVVPVGIEAQFIRINKTTAGGGTLHVGEVIANSLGTDVAVGSLGASGTTVHGSGGHGNPNSVVTGVASIGGETWTKNVVNTGPGVFESEVLIDLGQVRGLQEVQVLQRGDGCCTGRLADFSVSLEDATNTTVFNSGVFAGTAPTVTTINLGTGSMILPGDDGVIGTETVGSGRFVQVINNGGSNRLLHIGELEVFEPGVAAAPNFDNANDLALASNGASIKSASTAGGHGGTGAVIDGSEQTGGSTWTKQQTGGGSQITADLGGTFDVDRIRAHQRNDGCCQGRLSNFTVNVFADDGTGNVGMLVDSASVGGTAPTNSFSQVSFGSPAFTIGANDILKIELDPNAMTADLLSVGVLGDGALTIESGAILEITLLNFGIAHGTTQIFDILDFGSVDGEFSAINFTNLDGRFVVDASNLLSDGTISLTHIPEPTTAVLSLFGVAGLAARRRRRLA